MTTPSHLIQFFQFAHLPPHLQAVSKPFGELAMHIEATLPPNAEKTTALRKLLEAKDCAVRALLYKPVEGINAPKPEMDAGGISLSASPLFIDTTTISPSTSSSDHPAPQPPPPAEPPPSESKGSFGFSVTRNGVTEK